MNKFIVLSLLPALTLSACIGSLKPSMMEDSIITPRPIELHQDRFVETMSKRDITYDYLARISEDYKHRGKSPLYIVFGYDPDEKGAKLSAFNHSNIVKGQLGKLGISNAMVETTPVIGSDGTAVIGYDRMTATGPSNCGKMPGLGNTQTGAYGDYGLGCTVKDYMAQQVATPSDLEGVGGLGERNDGMRAANIANRDVRAGNVNTFVPSYILSELAGNTTD